MTTQITPLAIITYFILYSVLGWMVEVVYQALTKGVVVNRGFLNGPVCPIYGFGVVGIFLTVTFIFGRNISSVSFGAIFLCGIIIATSIELFGGWVLDRCFHARWWDYREKPFNFHGYICLEFSIIWGLGIVLVVREVQPLVRSILAPFLAWRLAPWLVAAACLLYFADFVVSVFIMIGLNKRFAELDELRQRMRVVSDELSSRIGTEALETAQKMDDLKVQTSLVKAELRDALEDNRLELEEARAEMLRAREQRIQSLAQEVEDTVSEMRRIREEKQEALAQDVEAAIEERTRAREQRLEALAQEVENAKAEMRRIREEKREALAQEMDERKRLLEEKKEEFYLAYLQRKHFGFGRVMRAFPQMEHRDYEDVLDELREQFNLRG
jgi:uncharacterized membrane protein